MGEYFERHGRTVYSVCRLILRDPQEAEDAAQQVFLSAHRSILGGMTPDDPPAWLARIARNECLDRLRRRGAATVPLLDSDEDPGLGVADAVDQRAEIDALAEALAELAPSQRRAVVLREFYGLSYVEVAAALGLSEPAVESLLFKGRKRLQERLRGLRTSGAWGVPVTLYDALAQILPSFSAGVQAAPAAGSIARLAAVPAAVKLAAVVFALGAGGALTSNVAPRAPRPVAIRIVPVPAPTPTPTPASTVRRSAPTVAAIRAAAAPAAPRAQAVVLTAPVQGNGDDEPASQDSSGGDGQRPRASTPSRAVVPAEESVKRSDPTTAAIQSEGSSGHGPLSLEVQVGASQNGDSHGGDGGDGGDNGGSDSSS